MYRVLRSRIARSATCQLITRQIATAAAKAAPTIGEPLMQQLESRRLMCTLDHPVDEGHFATGDAVTEIEPNNTAASATAWLTASDTLGGSLSSASDVDYFQGSLTAGQTLNVSVGTDPGQRHYKPRVEIRDSADRVVATSVDGRNINYTAASDGVHYVRMAAASAYGNVIGSYGTDGGANAIRITVSNASGALEAEPNDTVATANTIPITTAIRGLLSAGDVDFFNFSTSAASSVALKFSTPSSLSPSVRILNAAGTVLFSNLTGGGIFGTLPASGSYRLQLAGDNASGAFAGGYAASFSVVANAINSVEPAAGAHVLSAAPTLPVTSTSRAAGILDGVNDRDAFAVELIAGRSYNFSIDTAGGTMRHARSISLLNEFGQLMETSYTGTLSTNAATGFGFRAERTGRHYIVIQATGDTGVGGYTMTSSLSGSFPTRRDTPLVFHDYTGQRTHLGYGPAAPLLNPATIPLLVGSYKSRYDIYDIDTTTVNPGTGTFITFGAGEFGSIGAYGYGGSFNQNSGSATVGSRRVSGQSVLDDSGSGFTSFSNVRFPISVMNQEIGHASGTYAHAREPQAAMAYDSQSSLVSIGQYTPFPWTDSRVPDVEFRNEREYYDWVLQSGRIAEETGVTSDASPMALTALLAEMTADALPRNDKVTVAGRIDGVSDADVYTLTVTAGQRFAFDIDSAEFQHPLDARLEVRDASGNLVASSTDALDRESGLNSVDPYIADHTFAAGGTYTIKVIGDRGTFGNYRLKLTSSAAFETDGPRVIASLPNGGTTFDSTRQFTFFFDDQIDPTTLSNATVIVTGATSGVRTGTMRFDPTDTSLVWYADAALPVDSYTVRFVGGAGGLTDLRGNPLDGNSDGTLSFPEISGDGVAGGDFLTSFTINAADNTPSSPAGQSIRRHPYNRVLFTLTFADELSIRDTYAAPLQLRGAGPDNVYNSADDRFVAFDLLLDKVKATGFSTVEIFSRGALQFGNYRVEGAVRDAAGFNVNVNVSFNYNSNVGNGNLVNGPSISELSVPADGVAAAGTTDVSVRFSMPLDLSTLTASNVRLRYSPTPTFFDADDTFINDADGSIAWDATNLRATFRSSSPLAAGYYRIEVSDAVTAAATAGGLALDGEFLSTRINGGDLYTHWQQVASGDGFSGGDYAAMFIVAGPVGDTIAPTLTSADYKFNDAAPALQFAFSESVAASLSVSDLILFNRTTNTTVSSATLAYTYDTATNTVRLTPLTGEPFADGNYRLTFAAGSVTDAAGNALTATPIEFYVLAGDANRDRTVNFADLVILAQNYNTAGKTFSGGNFNYSADGTVDFADLVILAQRYNISVPALPSALVATTRASGVVRRRDIQSLEI